MNLSRNVTLPELALLAGTRGMLGAGIGLLAAPHMGDEERRAVGKTLLLIGLVTTIPLALEIFRPRTKEQPSFGMQLV
jgi:hypothetical protein